MYHNNILARLGKPLPYNDQFMDSPALRTGTYTVDHLKLTTIVGMFFFIYCYFVKLIISFFYHIFNIKITKYMFRVLPLHKIIIIIIIPQYIIIYNYNTTGQGRYGSVWQGSMGDQDVAVKIYPSHYRNYFQNERDTYCLPFMEHPSLLSYYGLYIFC